MYGCASTSRQVWDVCGFFQLCKSACEVMGAYPFGMLTEIHWALPNFGHVTCGAKRSGLVGVSTSQYLLADRVYLCMCHLC